MLHVPLGQLLVSGAVAGVILSIAAQQSLGNAFAGVILIVSAPFRVGDYITLSSGALGGRYAGYVRDISLACLTLQTGNGRMSFASNAVMTAAVGRRPPPVAGPEGDVDGSAGVRSAAALGSEEVGEGTTRERRPVLSIRSGWPESLHR